MFPQKNARFMAFIEPAKGQRSGWFVLLGVCLIVIFYLEFMAAIIFSASIFLTGNGGLTEGYQNLSRLIATADTPLGLILALVTFVGMFGAVILTAWVTRERSPLSLVGSGPVLRNMGLAVLALGSIIGASTLAAHFFYDLVPNLTFQHWVIWMPIAMPFLFVQIAAEEMIFRGYLQQELAVRFKSPLAWMLVPSLIFGALHWDTETFGPNAWLIVVSTGLFGLFAADLTARTGNLGAAFGLHLINNFSAMFVTSMPGNMSGLSLYTTPFAPSDHAAIKTLLLWDIGLMLASYLIYLVVIRLKRVG